jgi:hypothetical protein
VIVFAVMALICLGAGTIGYLGLWRGWTGQDGDRSTLLGVFWMGIGFVIAAVSQAVPALKAQGTTMAVALGVVVLGGIFVYLIPPFLTPRWYRQQRAARR